MLELFLLIFIGMIYSLFQPEQEEKKTLSREDIKMLEKMLKEKISEIEKSQTSNKTDE